MDKESIYELQKIDANCNDCFFMKRDFETFKHWEGWRRSGDLEAFNTMKSNLISSAKVRIQQAKNDQEKRSAEGELREAMKMNFQFTKGNPVNYGHCNKFDTAVSFLPGTCQIETQECFLHRKDMKL